jgi:hypothetical protein
MDRCSRRAEEGTKLSPVWDMRIWRMDYWKYLCGTVESGDHVGRWSWIVGMIGVGGTVERNRAAGVLLM